MWRRERLRWQGSKWNKDILWVWREQQGDQQAAWSLGRCSLQDDKRLSFHISINFIPYLICTFLSPTVFWPYHEWSQSKQHAHLLSTAVKRLCGFWSPDEVSDRLTYFFWCLWNREKRAHSLDRALVIQAMECESNPTDDQSMLGVGKKRDLWWQRRRKVHLPFSPVMKKSKENTPWNVSMVLEKLHFSPFPKMYAIAPIWMYTG